MADTNEERTSVFTIDRVIFTSRAALVEVIADHLNNGVIVQVEDSTRPGSMRLCYEVRPSEAATRLINAHGRRIGVYADAAALVAHGEAVTKPD